MNMIIAIAPAGDSFPVEYARFAGNRCEAVGFGEASTFSDFDTQRIGRVLRRRGYRMLTIPVC